jgi:lysozyme family protein
MALWLKLNLKENYNMPFDKDLATTLKFEGGLTTDTGGLTNYGVRQDIYDSYTKANKLPSKSVKELKYGDVRDFYETEYYKKPGINLLPEEIQGVVFDSAVNLGQGTTIKQLQSIVGSKADGIMGKKTTGAVNEYIKKNGVEGLKFELLNTRFKHYNSLVEQNPAKYGKYINGWEKRLESLAKE